MLMKVYRGNDFVITFQRLNSEGNVITTIPNNIWFSVKKKTRDDRAVISKSLNNGITCDSNGLWTLTLNANDTENLDFGSYLFDIKVLDENGMRRTIAPPQEFVVGEVVTRRINE